MAKKQLSEATLTTALQSVEKVLDTRLGILESPELRKLDERPDDQKRDDIATLCRARDEIKAALEADEPVKGNGAPKKARGTGKRRGLPGEERSEA